MGTLDDLFVFSVVVEELGFRAAARRLGVATSAVSRSVRRVEQRMRGTLLVRSTRSLALTDLGQEVYAQCARLGEAARELDAIAEHHGGRPQGVLRVGAPVAFGLSWLVPRLASFAARWPEVQVELTLDDEVVDLLAARCDVALRISRRLADGLVARRLLDFGFVAVASPGYLARAGAPADAAALPQHAVLCLGQSGYGTRLALRRGDESVVLQARSALRANNSVALLQAAQAGLGIAIVPDFVAGAALADGSLQTVLAGWRLEAPYEGGSVSLVWLPTRQLPAKTRVFVDHLLAAG